MTKQNYHHGDLRNALIQAGAEILFSEGVGALSLRSVARKAGVSHSAPYAHFADKKSLIAAISTYGFHLLSDELQFVIDEYSSNPPMMLVKFALTYCDFALKNPAYFKLMFSGIMENEKGEYPAFVETSQQGFELLLQVVNICQQAGVLAAEDAEIQAVNLWSLVHGHTALLLERQFSHHLLNRVSSGRIIWQGLQQFTKIEQLPFPD